MREKKQYPKWLCNLICCFILKKKNRQHFRKKYLKKDKITIIKEEYENKIDKLSSQIDFLYFFLETTQEKTKIKPIEKLKKYQNEILYILILFDKICRKYNIKYWLEGGTLLGAVRHKGFIP